MKLDLKVMLYIVFVHLLLLTGCNLNSLSKSISGQPPGSVNVWLPWNKSNGTYNLQKVTLTDLQSLDTLKGKHQKFLYSPGITQKGKLVGELPRAHYFEDANGDVFPTDQLSTELFVIYAHLQKLRKLESTLGGYSANRHLDIGVSVRYLDQGQAVTNNAMFVGGLNAFLFVPYTNGNLPISLNAGIIAHEYFHSIFYKHVNESLNGIDSLDKFSIHSADCAMENAFPELWARDLSYVKIQDIDRNIRTLSPISKLEEDELYEKTILRGLNEGLADFWGWLYSQDTDFIATSLPSESENRRLDVEPKVINKKKDFENVVTTVADSRSLVAASYKLGTEVARQLVTASGIVNPENPKLGALVIAKTLIKNLSTMKDQVLIARDQGTRISPSRAIYSLVGLNRDLSAKECSFWKSHLTAEEINGFDAEKDSCQ